MLLPTDLSNGKIWTTSVALRARKMQVWDFDYVSAHRYNLTRPLLDCVHCGGRGQRVSGEACSEGFRSCGPDGRPVREAALHTGGLGCLFHCISHRPTKKIPISHFEFRHLDTRTHPWTHITKLLAAAISFQTQRHLPTWTPGMHLSTTLLISDHRWLEGRRIRRLPLPLPHTLSDIHRGPRPRVSAHMDNGWPCPRPGMIRLLLAIRGSLAYPLRMSIWAPGSVKCNVKSMS